MKQISGLFEGENWAVVYSENQINPEFVVYGHDARRGRDEEGNIVIQEHPYATGLDTRFISFLWNTFSHKARFDKKLNHWERNQDFIYA